MSPNSWVIEMAAQKSRLSVHPQQRRLSPHPHLLGNDAFVRPAEAPVENPVFEDIGAILSVLKASGLLPIYEQVSSFEVGPPTRTNEFYSFFVRGVVHALTIFNIYSLMTPNGAKLFISLRETDNVNQWIELLLCILTYTLTVFVCARNTKCIIQIMNDILKLDQEVLRQFGVALSNNCNFSIKFLLLIAACQAYIIFIRIHVLDGEITPTTYILIGFYAVQNGLTATYIVFASALLRIVCIRFQFVNGLLNGYSYAQQLGKSRRQRQSHMESFPEDSLFIYRTHNRLLRIYKSINECCSLIIVCFLGYSFYTVTTNWYNLFVQITNNRGVISSHIMQWCLAWLCLHTSLLTLLSRSCGATTYEANTTSQILARVYGKSKEFQNIIDKFLTKSIKQEVQFTAYGFFAIDNSTLFKIFSAVTTYLVILIQFKQLEDSKLEEQLQETH
ncbi:gustatory and pheromone receptor 32a isoform X1 [Drosophila montana]|uniref:gustatory and pheromone receptor 32a isoform X1 n=1 Tax=Drosophila montana TaxID=40370 RepID=UPI00313BC192